MSFKDKIYKMCLNTGPDAKEKAALRLKILISHGTAQSDYQSAANICVERRQSRLGAARVVMTSVMSGDGTLLLC